MDGRAVLLGALLSSGAASLALSEEGEDLYRSLCSRCHGEDGAGGEVGPGISPTIALRSDEELAALLEEGRPGMPVFRLPEEDGRELIDFLRSLQPGGGRASVPAKVETTDGRALEGVVLNESYSEKQILTNDGRAHLLRKEGDRYRAVTSDVDWPTYHGDLGGNRHTALAQIDKSNVSRLAPRWTFTLAGAGRLQVTPVVVSGLMYVTSANECYALDAGSGRELWHYRRPRTPGLSGDASGGINRGVAVSGNQVFMVTDHAHLIALDRFTGRLLWETEMADWRENYGATSAPLAIGKLVVSGTSGGDEGVRGFLAAYDAATGSEVWRFWTAPKPGEPGAETWQGKAIDHPCASAWLTGTYDAELGTLFWPTGNPCPDFDGDERLGDNLYSDAILALDAASGALKWFFQYTPHDVWDWDAQQPPVLVDREWRGTERKLLLHANRNGFFYVLDRTNGKLLLAEPFVRNLTWAKAIGPDGRPVLNPNQEPTAEGTRVCPAVEGATNWFSTSFDPERGLYYVQTLEKCNIFMKSPEEWQPGRSYYGGSTKTVPGETPKKILRAIEIETGAIVWELPQVGRAGSWGGVMSTASGLVLFGDDSGSFAAADASTGERLWEFPTGQLWKASPMTYSFDARQFIAVASGPNILAFALVE